VIRVEGVVKGYPHGVQALGGVSFSVRPGELVAVLGPSGAGKTTLFRCLTGLTRPDAGQVFIQGRDICRIAGRELRMARRDVALIFQQFNLIRRLTAVQNVLAGRLASLSTWRVVMRRFPRADRQIALACLDRVGLVDRAYARADRLSGGQQQRVAIARALAQEARLILADEPVASLDLMNGALVMDTLRRVASILAVTHKKVEVASTNLPDLQQLTREGKVPRGALRVIWVSKLIPNDPIVVRKDLPDSLRQAIQDALVAMQETHPEVFAAAGSLVGGFHKVDDATYQVIRELNETSKRLVAQH